MAARFLVGELHGASSGAHDMRSGTLANSREVLVNHAELHHRYFVVPWQTLSSIGRAAQMIARLLRTPVYPVISMMLSVLVWKPALASLRARKVRSPDPAPKVKADAPLAVKLVVVSRLEIVVDLKLVPTDPSLRRL